MVKIGKLPLCFIYILCVFFITSCSSSINNTFGPNYQVTQKQIHLFPIKPLAVLGLNTFIVEKENSMYLVVIAANVKQYKWLIDTIQVKKTAVLDSDQQDYLPELPTNLYLSEDIEFILHVKNLQHHKVNTAKLKYAPDIIELPYFIAVNNKINNKIDYLESNSISIDLNTLKPIKFTRNFKIKFNEKDFDNLEIIIGFKQTEDNFLNLQKKLNLLTLD